MEITIAVINRLTSWPVAIFILAGWMFREQIVGLLIELRIQLPRVRKAGPIGIELDALERQKEEGPSPAANNILLLPLAEPPPSDAITVLERELIQGLISIPEEERTRNVVRQLAIVRVQAGHEFVYNRIFDSQLVALRRLNTATSASVDNARDFLGTYCAEHNIPSDLIKFDSWLHFLLSNSLINRNDDTLTITTLGRELLLYIISQKLPDLKGVL